MFYNCVRFIVCNRIEDEDLNFNIERRDSLLYICRVVMMMTKAKQIISEFSSKEKKVVPVFWVFSH